MEEDPEREKRITYEIIVDAYNEDERAMGWYYCLENKLDFPFDATCIKQRRTSPLDVGECVKAVGMAPEEECESDMFVEIEWKGRRLAVPLAQLEPGDADDATTEAVGDWHYWLAKGYEF